MQVETTTEAPARRARYASVNGQWPVGTNEGRDVKPTPQEAVTGFRRLYRKAFGRPYRGRILLTSGNRKTWYGGPGRSVRVNPDENGGGWHEIVHSVSHMASRALYKENHGPSHAFIERELITFAVESGFLSGALKREAREPKPAPDPLIAIDAKIARWESKRKRAETALKKLRRSRAGYVRRRGAT